MSDQPHYPNTEPDESAQAPGSGSGRTPLLYLLAILGLVALLVVLHLTGVVGG